MNERERLTGLRGSLKHTYMSRTQNLPFHGWHHIEFVEAKVCTFAQELGADLNLCRISALVHDLNHLDAPGSRASAGASRIEHVLSEAGYPKKTILRIQKIVVEAETAGRGPDISQEAKALSDSDTLFKALPVTPVLLAHRYLSETSMTVHDLAEKIVSEQTPLREKEIYFYTELGERLYGSWASANLALWHAMLECLHDPDVLRLLSAL